MSSDYWNFSYGKLIVLPVILFSIVLSSCSVSSGIGIVCEIIPNANCLISANLSIPQHIGDIDVAGVKLVLDGRNVAIKPGIYKANILARNVKNVILDTYHMSYIIKDKVARIVKPDLLKKWLHNYSRKGSVTLQVVFDEVPMIVTHPSAKSGKMAATLIYKGTALASSENSLIPMGGCWYNELACSHE